MTEYGRLMVYTTIHRRQPGIAPECHSYISSTRESGYSFAAMSPKVVMTSTPICLVPKGKHQEPFTPTRTYIEGLRYWLEHATTTWCLKAAATASISNSLPAELRSSLQHPASPRPPLVPWRFQRHVYDRWCSHRDCLGQTNPCCAASGTLWRRCVCSERTSTRAGSATRTNLAV